MIISPKFNSLDAVKNEIKENENIIISVRHFTTN